jgi:hypothetical protein
LTNFERKLAGIARPRSHCSGRKLAANRINAGDNGANLLDAVEKRLTQHR